MKAGRVYPVFTWRFPQPSSPPASISCSDHLDHTAAPFLYLRNWFAMATPSLASESFQRSLDRFRDKLSDEQKKDFEMVSINQVKTAIEQIQAQIGPEKKLRNFARLNAFLEGMKQVEELVTIFLNVHEVVAFVWVCDQS